MYKRDKCFIETKRQHVSFVVWHFLLALLGGDLWSTDYMNQSCSEKYKSIWTHYEKDFLELERLEVWHSENLVFGHAPSAPQQEGPKQGMCMVLAETSECRGPFLSLPRSENILVWGEGVSESAAEATGSPATPSIFHLCQEHSLHTERCSEEYEKVSCSELD